MMDAILDLHPMNSLHQKPQLKREAKARETDASSSSQWVVWYDFGVSTSDALTSRPGEDLEFTTFGMAITYDPFPKLKLQSILGLKQWEPRMEIEFED